VPPGPLPFHVLLDEAQRLARRHFRAIYPAVAIPLALVTTAVTAIQAHWFSSRMADLGAQAISFLNPAYLGVTLLHIALLLVGYNAMQVAAVRATSGAPVDMRQAWRFTVRARTLGTLLLWYAMLFASLGCCCLPVFFVAPLLSFIPPAMVEEGRFGLQAISRSVDLARRHPPGRWQESPLIKAALLLLVGTLLGYLVGLLVSLPFLLPGYVNIFRKAAAGEDFSAGMSSLLWMQVPAQCLNALASAAVYLYVCFGIALLFHDARGRQEGTDLRAEIESAFPPPGEPGP
jgi:hypothetical protein